MGNSNSSHVQGKLSIIVDPSPTGFYIAGHNISGSVYAHSKTNISSNLNIGTYITGKERSRVRYQEMEYYHEDGERKSRSVTRYRYADRDILRLAIDLGNVSTASPGDSYRFPFRVQLPSNLPSSMRCEGGGGHCEITYKIKAELHGSGGTLFGNHKVERVINVESTPLPMQPVPNSVPPVTQRVNFLCCFNVGKITMGARVANTRIGQGETAVIDFACQNQSRRHIEKAEVTVKEDVTWSAGGRSNHFSRVIANEAFSPTDGWQELDKAEMKKQIVLSKDLTRDACQQNQLLEMIHAAINDGKNRALLGIPLTGLQSYQGLLIQVHHQLRIIVSTSGCCTGNPKIKLPIYIGTPTSHSPQTESQVQKPLPTAAAVPMSLAMPTVVPSAPPPEWANAVTAAPVVVGQSAAIVGGNSTWEAEDPNTMPHGNDTVVMAVAEIVPSLPNLLKEIEFSVSPLSTVTKWLGEEEWRARVFHVMTPSGYASVIKSVAIEFDQPEMGALVAPEVANFTHYYIIAALRVVADWIRTPLLSKVIPLCQDLTQNVDKIKAELSDWELVCTEQCFEQGSEDWGLVSPLLR
mmetsp:Transcript_31659/g.76629  ORF Transcript_31659/g.76629 Transcript_31659/m.76629 type:complete len:579 (-) Transcript_31659:203-1939(-)